MYKKKKLYRINAYLKDCTLFAPKKCKLGIEYSALVLMLLTKFDPNIWHQFFNNNAKFALIKKQICLT